jgi:aspartyl-tRNA(Asn)/glutamyl-tRNA(Gln) amidotransferase subunit A
VTVHNTVPDVVATTIATLSAVDMVAAFASRTLSPVEVYDAVEELIAEVEPVINAFYVRDQIAARSAAEASTIRWARSEPLGLIDGVPVTLKENIARKGVPMPAGTACSEALPALADAPITARVKESGAVVLGSTTMPDWGMLSSGVSSLHGITRSPWNPEWTTGGSSAGAGAAAAAGFGPLHVGTDIGGSIRLPGTWLGLVAHKPSYGRVPLDAPYFGRCAGPITRTVGDAALFMQVLSQPDVRDWSSLPQANIDWSDLDLDVRGLRVAVHVDAGCGMAVDPVVAEAVEGAAQLFADAGAIVEQITPFMTPTMLEDLDLFWRVRSWNDFVQLSPQRQSDVLPFIVDWCSGGAKVSGARTIACYQSTMKLRAATVAATAAYDLVLSPVAPTVAFPAEWPMPFGNEDGGMAHIGFCAPYSMSGQPACSINCGFTDDHKTIGVQIAGRRFDDLGVLRACAWYEQARPASATPVWPF